MMRSRIFVSGLRSFITAASRQISSISCRRAASSSAEMSLGGSTSTSSPLVKVRTGSSMSQGGRSIETLMDCDWGEGRVSVGIRWDGGVRPCVIVGERLETDGDALTPTLVGVTGLDRFVG